MKKKFLFIFAAFSLWANIIVGQTSNFYVNKATSVATECDCANLKSVKVTIPIPANVKTFDAYYLFLSPSSLDVSAYIYFDKAAIASKLAGKKEYTAFAIKDDGTSDFTFEDAYFAMRDLCSTPRMWGMSSVDVSATGAGYKIIGNHWEDVWNEQSEKWISTKIDDWDEGAAYGEGYLIVAQRPLSDGFSDENNVITVKAENTDSARYWVSQDVLVKGALAIDDNSDIFKTEIQYAYFDDATLSYDKLKEAVRNSVSGKFQVGIENPFYDLRDISSKNQKTLKGKSADFTKITLNGVIYENLSYCQVSGENVSTYESKQPGYYADFYLAKIGSYNIIIVSKTDEIVEKIPGMSMMDSATYRYDFKMTDENIAKIDAVTRKWISATSYK